MRVPYVLLALMGWVAVLGLSGRSAIANDPRGDSASDRQYEIGRAQLRMGEAALERGDYAEALRIWQPLADHGNAIAAYQVGLLYAEGNGVPRDMARARLYMERAAKEDGGDAFRWLKAHGFALDRSRNWSVAECAKAVESSGRNKHEMILKLCPALGRGTVRFHIDLADTLFNEYGDRWMALLNYKAAADMGSAEAVSRIARMDASPTPQRQVSSSHPGWPKVCTETHDEQVRKLCLIVGMTCNFQSALLSGTPQYEPAVNKCWADAMRRAGYR